MSKTSNSFFSLDSIVEGAKAPFNGGDALWNTLIYGTVGLLLGSSIAWSKSESGGMPFGRLGPIRLP